jgi:hypothetical protein
LACGASLATIETACGASPVDDKPLVRLADPALALAAVLVDDTPRPDLRVRGTNLSWVR